MVEEENFVMQTTSKKLVTITLAVALCALLVGTLTSVWAGAVGGPKQTRTRVQPGGTDVFTVAFRAGESARILLSGDGDTDLDLYIFDALGNLISKDDDRTDDCVAQWTPRWTGKFTIKVVNRGAVYNEYTLITN